MLNHLIVIAALTLDIFEAVFLYKPLDIEVVLLRARYSHNQMRSDWADLLIGRSPFIAAVCRPSLYLMIIT